MDLEGVKAQRELMPDEDEKVANVVVSAAFLVRFQIGRQLLEGIDQVRFIVGLKKIE